MASRTCWMTTIIYMPPWEEPTSSLEMSLHQATHPRLVACPHGRQHTDPSLSNVKAIDKKSSYSVKINDITTKVESPCLVCQVPSYEAYFIILAWFLAYLSTLLVDQLKNKHAWICHCGWSTIAPVLWQNRRYGRTEMNISSTEQRFDRLFKRESLLSQLYLRAISLKIWWKTSVVTMQFTIHLYDKLKR